MPKIIKNLKNSVEKGRWGEKMATEYLLTKGHTLLAKNYRCPHGEVDIITKNDNIIHFIEVKSVSRETEKSVIHEAHVPEENVHIQKINRIARSSEYFMFENRLYGIYFQIDLITVRLIGDDGVKIEFFPNINL